jgi:Mor family transcriptional regulator
MKVKVKREHRKTLLFNNAEMEAIHSFCKKYKITNQAKFFREAIITTILKKTEEDHPKLF